MEIQKTSKNHLKCLQEDYEVSYAVSVDFQDLHQYISGSLPLLSTSFPVFLFSDSDLLDRILSGFQHRSGPAGAAESCLALPGSCSLSSMSIKYVFFGRVFYELRLLSLLTLEGSARDADGEVCRHCSLGLSLRSDINQGLRLCSQRM